MSHTFTAITVEDGSTEWEWCIRCGALRLNKEIMRPGSNQTKTVRGSVHATECPASKTPRWRHHKGDDYYYYKHFVVIGPREGWYSVAGTGKTFKQLKDAKAFVESKCQTPTQKRRSRQTQ
jgi:hypothetical protein